VSKYACWVTGMVMVDAAAKTNSVTISDGIKLDAFLSSSFRSAPSRDYIKSIFSQGPCRWEASDLLRCSEPDSKHLVSSHDDNADPARHQGHPLHHGRHVLCGWWVMKDAAFIKRSRVAWARVV
jgi:hypothetical protein